MSGEVRAIHARRGSWGWVFAIMIRINETEGMKELRVQEAEIMTL